MEYDLFYICVVAGFFFGSIYPVSSFINVVSFHLRKLYNKDAKFTVGRVFLSLGLCAVGLYFAEQNNLLRIQMNGMIIFGGIILTNLLVVGLGISYMASQKSEDAKQKFCDFVYGSGYGFPLIVLVLFLL